MAFSFVTDYIRDGEQAEKRCISEVSDPREVAWKLEFNQRRVEHGVCASILGGFKCTQQDKNIDEKSIKRNY